MSIRTEAPTAAPSRFRGPIGWLRDRPIWTKLGIIMIVPVLATIVVGVQGLLDHVGNADLADRARTLAVLSGQAGHLVDELQDERANAVMLLGAEANKVDSLKSAFGQQGAKTDAVVSEYRYRRSTLADPPQAVRTLLDKIETELAELTGLRQQISERTAAQFNASYSYGGVITDLLRIRDLSTQLTGNSILTDRLRATAAVANAKEYLSEERVIILQALANGQFPREDYTRYIVATAGLSQSLDTFRTAATGAQQQLYNVKVNGPQVRETRKYEQAIDSLTGTTIPGNLVPSDKWDEAMIARASLMNEVENTLNAEAIAYATKLGDTAQRQVLVETGVLLATLLLGVLFAWLVARSMARSLRDLRQGALAVAQYGLPQAVARLRDPALSGQMAPHQIAAQIADPLPVRSRDEFGQVTEAFNAVHLEAVRTAAEQAALRSSVATMFVNLARRSQILVDRLIGHLDRLERGEQDPDRLSELFQLDHLATRMRRNDENLLVLAGADSTRIQREPAALVDVLRAAQSEVEHYTRIQFGVMDQDVEIAAHAVNDLVHLVAELFDNATAYSPPDTAVNVEARRLGDRAVLQVEDRGIGMSSEQYSELNERLAAPPAVDVTVSRMMGLVVVARLAGRHGVRVELRRAPERGTVAEVHLPPSVLVPRALAGRTATPAGFPAATPVGFGASRTAPPEVPGRPAFAAPLALESGPVGNGGWPPLVEAGHGAPDLFGPPPESYPPGGYQPPGAFPLGQPGYAPGQPFYPGEPPYGAGGPGETGYTGFDQRFPAPQNGGPPSSGGGPLSPDSLMPPMNMPPMGAPPAPGGYGQDHGAFAPDRGGFGQEPPAGYGHEPPAGYGQEPGRFSQERGGFAAEAGAFGAEPGRGNGRGTGGRTAPAWHDLTGVGGAATASPAPPADTARRPGDPLPQRRPGGDGEPMSPDAPQIPRQVPASPEAYAGPSAPPLGAPPLGAYPPGEGTVPPTPFGAPHYPPGGDGGFVPNAARPPAWPPAAEAPPTDREAAAAADYTAELPHVSVPSADEGTQGRPDYSRLLDAVPTPPSRYADDLTMELPIFRELESAWFRVTSSEPDDFGLEAPQIIDRPTSPAASPPTPEAPPTREALPKREAPPTPEAAPQPARTGNVRGAESYAVSAGLTSPAGTGAGRPTGPGGTDGAARPVGEVSWRTVADDGWQAAADASKPKDGGTTDMGLPKRVPMAQLVPGGVDNATAGAQRRTPESVRGLLSAYHRGVQRGRTAQGNGDAGATSTGAGASTAPHRGKEQEA